MWRSSRTPEGAAGYIVASEMRIRGPLDLGAFRASVQHAVDGQELLRTTYVERESRPLQTIGEPAPIEIPLVDLDAEDHEMAVTAFLRHHAQQPFDLARGPVLRLWIARVSDDDHRLLRLNHHIATDALSWRIFFTEFARAYEALRRGERPPALQEGPQYADFAAWEHERLRGDDRPYRDEVDWWRRAFEHQRPVLRLPFSRPEPDPEAPPEDGIIYWGVQPGEAVALDEQARAEGTTPYVVRLALFTALLGLETGQEEIVLGTYAMTRTLPETRSMFGFFSNPITLIIQFDPKLSFRRWLSRVREVVAEAKARSEMPYELLAEELRRGGTPPPELNALFYLRSRWPDLRVAGIELGPPRYTIVGMPWGFSFIIDPNRESDWCLTMFDARIHDPKGVRSFIERYRRFAARVVAKPSRRLRRLGP
jgi:hypothetical protein